MTKSERLKLSLIIETLQDDFLESVKDNDFATLDIATTSALLDIATTSALRELEHLFRQIQGGQHVRERRTSKT